MQTGRLARGPRVRRRTAAQARVAGPGGVAADAVRRVHAAPSGYEQLSNRCGVLQITFKTPPKRHLKRRI
ncbi:hypothetical protein PSP6_400055 [Paraburkholderia tropica]|nr:hypothetical protein PSP6_400055 [Paraburkholderia tropica]